MPWSEVLVTPQNFEHIKSGLLLEKEIVGFVKIGISISNWMNVTVWERRIVHLMNVRHFFCWIQHRFISHVFITMTFLSACFITRIERSSKCSVCVVQRIGDTLLSLKMFEIHKIRVYIICSTNSFAFFLLDAVIIRKFQFCCFNIKLVFADNQNCFSCWLTFGFNLNLK